MSSPEPKPNLGWLRTPHTGESIRTIVNSGQLWACDNAAYSKWEPVEFVKLLGKVAGQPRLLWVAVPDVVADAGATLKKFRDWQPMMKELQLPLALVAQNGLQSQMVPWGDIACLFIGGDDKFKLGAQAAALVIEAKQRGKWVHMGRVNSLARMRYAATLGCDSIDGMQWSAFRKTYAPLAQKGLNAPRQLGLVDILTS